MTDRTNVGILIAELGSEQPGERMRARAALEEVGTSAVAGLVAALGDSRETVRWEAAKILGGIQEREAIPALVDALTDPEPGIRWLAAEALIAQGDSGVRPLLRKLIERPPTFSMLGSAHHVLHDVRSQDLEEVRAELLEALESTAPEVRVPVVAKSALDRMRR